jgi:transcriptional regulator with XRE-family HTH domain
MNAMLYIRKNVFGVTQAEMACIAGVSQGTISKWETGTVDPDREDLGRIRKEAARRKLRWQDDWFFSAPRATA